MSTCTANRRLQRLQRRRDYLGRLINGGEANDWDRSEYSALCWAVKVIEANWDTAVTTSGQWRAHLKGIVA
jgi:hypothetical protein